MFTSLFDVFGFWFVVFLLSYLLFLISYSIFLFLFQSNLKLFGSECYQSNGHACKDEDFFPDGSDTQSFNHDAFDNDEIPLGRNDVTHYLQGYRHVFDGEHEAAQHEGG